MAVDQDLLDQIAGTIADLYAEVESALIKTIAARLREGLDFSPYQEGKLDAVRKLRDAAQRIYNTLQATKAGAIRDAVAAAYRSGSASALTDLSDLTHAGHPRLPVTSLGQAARGALRDVPNAVTIENIAQAVHSDLGRVEGNILRVPIDAYRAVQAAAATRVATGIETRRQASQAAWQRLVDKGIVNFVDRAGRTWRLSSYAEMIARTNVARAATQGQTDRLGSLGVNLVIVSNHSQECKLCRPYEGKILSIGGPTGNVQVEHATRDGVMVTVHVKDTLDGARAHGFQHPNCRHSVSAYTPGITKQPTDTEDPEGDQARQKQRSLERKIRAAKEQELAALDGPAKKAAGQKVRAAQAALRDHLAANPKLKRLRYREQIGAGNVPPRGGPQGGPVRDIRPPGGQPLTPTPKPKPGPAVPDAARPYHRNLDDGLDKLAHAVEQGVREERPLGGGAVAKTDLVTLKNGQKVVRKTARPSSGGVQEAAGEQLGSLVARKLGLKAPRVYRNGEDTIWMEHADGKTPDELGLYADHTPPRVQAAFDSDDGKVMGLLDLLIENYDRNSGNWLLDDNNRIIPIDHGVAWSEIDELGGRLNLESRNEFGDHYVGPNPLTAADVDEVQRRLESLRPDFEHLGKGNMLDYSLRVLDALAGNASGTQNLIAGVR